jgi:hypothetical protein
VPRGCHDRLRHAPRPLLREERRSILCERLLATVRVGGVMGLMGDDSPTGLPTT